MAAGARPAIPQRSQPMSQTEGKMTREEIDAAVAYARIVVREAAANRFDSPRTVQLAQALIALAHDACREGVLEIGLLKAVRDIAMCRMSGHGAVSMEEFGPWARNIAIKAVEEHDNALASRADSAAVEGKPADCHSDSVCISLSECAAVGHCLAEHEPVPAQGMVVPPVSALPEWVRVPRKVVEFLRGAGPLDGMWFGESKEPHRKFWWRKYLGGTFAASQEKPE